MGTDRPPAPEGLQPGRGDLFRFAVFGLCLALWTWKLLQPVPVPEELTSSLGGDGRFILAKALHAGVYAFLTVLVCALPVPRYWRRFLVGLLLLHGVATEVGQTFVPNRSGSARDVALDWFGVACGVVLCRAIGKR